MSLTRQCADLVKTKSDRARRMPLSPRAMEAFESLGPGRGRIIPVKTNTGLFHTFQEARGEALKDICWHDLRYEAISRLSEDTDLREHETMGIGGHPTPAMLTH